MFLRRILCNVNTHVLPRAWYVREPKSRTTIVHLKSHFHVYTFEMFRYTVDNSFEFPDFFSHRLCQCAMGDFETLFISSRMIYSTKISMSDVQIKIRRSACICKCFKSISVEIICQVNYTSYWSHFYFDTLF
jgi:hypothetical protein